MEVNPMKNVIVAACALALGVVVMDGIQIEKTSTGLVIKPGQALAAELPVPPPAPVGKGKAPIGKGKGKAPAPIVTKG
jgi:hypothetical protein